ncbi:Putative flagellin yvzB [Agathobacter rectalis]|uniref:Flagellin n=4 Tax=Agathobacter rectalis TaxID=39491 RepID=A0A173UYC0_9FIRM|nr:Putative flagellin yvzB [Agathobacter rectalis]
MRKQIKGLDRASTNAEDGVSAVQTAEGALTEVHSMLQRMNELATQSANGTNSTTDRKAIQDEIDQLTTEIDRVSETTKFNETYLLKGDTDGATSKVKLNAHDAGLAGKLTDNGNGTATFKADTLAVGDKVKIAGKEYTIGKSADSADYAKKDTIKATVDGVGDSVTSGNTTTTIVAKVTTATATGATWAAGDKFKDADGTEWTIAATTDETAHNVKATDIAKYLKDGCTIVLNADNNKLDGVAVVDDLGKNEVSIADATGITALQNGIKAGDTVTVGGTTKTVTAETPKTYDEIKTAVAGGVAGTTKISIGSKEYTLDKTTDAAAGKITQDDFLALIKDGDKVKVGTNTYTAIIKSSDDDSITLEDAYSKMAKELETASSIGADTAATVKNNGNGTFDITKGTVDVKEALSFNLHVGADADSTNKITVDIDSMSSAGLGIKGIKADTEQDATYAIDAIADAISQVSSQRSALGAIQNRLEHTINNLDNVVENTTSAESRIRDTDMAEEMVNYSKNNILAQAGQSMLAQANQSNQGVLSLLQ